MPHSEHSWSKTCFPVGVTLARGDEAVGELLTVVGQESLEAKRGRLGQSSQETLGIGRRFGGVDRDVHPTGSPVNGDEQVSPFILIGPRGEVLYVDMDKAWHIGLEGLDLRFIDVDGLSLRDTVALEQAVQGSAGDRGREELRG